LEYVVLVLIAIVVGFRLVKAWRRAKPTPQPEQPPATHSRLWFKAFAAARPPSAATEANLRRSCAVATAVDAAAGAMPCCAAISI
jgi:hypothetical protein